MTAPLEMLSSNLVIYEAKNRMDGLHKLRSVSYRKKVLAQGSLIPQPFLHFSAKQQISHHFDPLTE